jgi:hypothetical protein
MAAVNGTSSFANARAIRRGASLFAICLTTTGLWACNVGKGVGAASGTLFELGCSKSGDYCFSNADGGCGSANQLVPYDLRPTFFAGEPIDDLREYSAGTAIMSNRLIIRLQRSGKQIEQNDVLTFDVTSSYEVARCVRGYVDKAGNNAWDPTNCFRASDNGPGRLRVQFDSVVHAALTLKATCDANLVASAISAPIPPEFSTTSPPVVLDGSWSSWVEFQDFGGANQSSVPPDQRQPISPKFHVGFGERIRATSFSLTLADDNVVNASINELPQPSPQIGGTLGGDPTTGRFDFDLERGQGAQFFP